MATDLTKLTKLELEALGREHGIELDRRLTKAKLVEQLDAHIKYDTTSASGELLETNLKVLRDETDAIVTFPDRQSARQVGHKKGGRAYNLNGTWVVKLY